MEVFHSGNRATKLSSAQSPGQLRRGESLAENDSPVDGYLENDVGQIGVNHSSIQIITGSTNVRDNVLRRDWGRQASARQVPSALGATVGDHLAFLDWLVTAGASAGEFGEHCFHTGVVRDGQAMACNDMVGVNFVPSTTKMKMIDHFWPCLIYSASRA